MTSSRADTSSYREHLDHLLNIHSGIFRGTVLDIGGRDRGTFLKPKSSVGHWIFADLTPEYRPDILTDVTNMDAIESESIDVVNAIELFEHVQEPSRGLTECYRVLKSGGTLVASMPFIFPIHGDPDDFQRWTDSKWKHELAKVGFKVSAIEPVGSHWSFFADVFRHFLKSKPRFVRFCLRPIHALLRRQARRQRGRHAAYSSGFFVVAGK